MSAKKNDEIKENKYIIYRKNECKEEDNVVEFTKPKSGIFNSTSSDDFLGSEKNKNEVSDTNSKSSLTEYFTDTKHTVFNNQCIQAQKNDNIYSNDSSEINNKIFANTFDAINAYNVNAFAYEKSQNTSQVQSLEYTNEEYKLFTNTSTCNLSYENMSEGCEYASNDKTTEYIDCNSKEVQEQQCGNILHTESSENVQKQRIKINRITRVQNSTNSQGKGHSVYLQRSRFYNKLVSKVYQAISDLKYPILHHSYEFLKNDVDILLRNAWLNDKIINCYLESLHEYDDRIYVFSSYFYTNLERHGIDKVRKYTTDSNLFTYRLLYFPIHKNNHWTFVCYDPKNKNLEYRDSLMGYSLSVMNLIVSFLEFEYERLYQEKIVITKKSIENVKQQENGYDCGVFTLMYAKHRLKNIDTFLYSDMSRYRYIILFELFVKKRITYFLYD